MNDLFQIPETPIPPLETAFKRLAKAIERERKADRIFDEQGPEALPGLEDARDKRYDAERAVEALERAAMKGTEP